MSLGALETENNDTLSQDEVRACLNRLTMDERKQLATISRMLSAGTGLDPDEIISDTVLSTMTDRALPRAIPFMACLVETMRSRVSNARKKAKRDIVEYRSPIGDQSDSVPQVVSVEPDAETDLIAREDAQAKAVRNEAVIAKITAALGDDYEAQLCLTGWSEGLKGKELHELCGVEQKDFDYLAKRVRRVAKRLLPEGWKP